MFVLDNSVSMRWLLPTQRQIDQNYAEAVLQNLIKTETVVPQLWRLEVVNVILTAEKHKQLELGKAERFILRLQNLPIQIDSLTTQQAFSKTFPLARNHKLSSYDAAYLELAMRRQLPLATLDKELRKAAERAKVKLYLA